MKTTTYILFVICLMTAFACEDDLNIAPQSVITTASMWQSEGDATAAMYGVLSQFRSALSNNYIYWGDYRSGFFGDGLVASASYKDMFLNSLDDEDTGTNWASLYTTINDCNLILKYVPEIEFDNDDDKNFILANAYFIRAFSYFYLARVWGNVPIVLSGFESDKQEDLYPSREPLENVFAQVASDIDEALKLFLNDDAGSRKTGSKAAANMLKADFYLWIAKTQNGGTDALNKAKTAVDYVLGNPNYQLLGDYETVFRNDNNNELIFALNFERDEYEGGFASDWLVGIQYVNDENLIENPIKVGGQTQWVTFADEFEAFLYEVGNDSRAKISLDTYEEVGNRHFKWINKYLGEWSNNTRFFISDIRIYRYAEAIMFKAEIENALENQSEALAQLNKIAKRAYSEDNFYSGNYSKEALDKIILDERLKEFAAEGKSWWDLIRFGEVFDRVTTLDGRENEENVLYWPVNVASINSNPNIKQTNGY
jgi:hypothetical protein